LRKRNGIFFKRRIGDKGIVADNRAQIVFAFVDNGVTRAELCAVDVKRQIFISFRKQFR
jgi:hypothetical protein